VVVNCSALIAEDGRGARAHPGGKQLHGGAGYMNEYMIARLWRDARVTRIYGGSNEIMKDVISRSL
jgi:alkylation response protein AidB-like acyl-CoA dehydrogenase